MSVWKQYSWSDFDPRDLPWRGWANGPAANLPENNNDNGKPPLFGSFDPQQTLITELSRPYAGHKAGARVVIEVKRIVIESGD
jgi:hypothetical protein